MGQHRAEDNREVAPHFMSDKVVHSCGRRQATLYLVYIHLEGRRNEFQGHTREDYNLNLIRQSRLGSHSFHRTVNYDLKRLYQWEPNLESLQSNWYGWRYGPYGMLQSELLRIT